METDLASFLSPAGSLLGEVTQRVLGFLSVQDLIDYVASASGAATSSNATATTSGGSDRDNDASDAEANEEGEESGSPENLRLQRYRSSSIVTGGSRGGGATHCEKEGERYSPEDELPHNHDRRSSKSTTGAGDEAGGVSRPPTPYHGRRLQSYRLDDRVDEESGTSNHGGYSSGSGERQISAAEHTPRRSWGRQPHQGRGVQILARRRSRHDGEKELTTGAKKEGGNTSGGGCRRDIKRAGQQQQQERRGGGGGILWVLIDLGLHPLTALGAVQGAVAQLLGSVPLLALLRWAAGGASAVLGVSFRVAMLPYDVTMGAVAYVVGSLETMLTVATEIWCELRHLSLAELAVVISCVVSGNPLPDFLLNPLDYGGPDSGSSCGGVGRGGGMAGNSRMMSRSSRGTGSLESDDPGFMSGYTRGGGSGQRSDADPRSIGPSGSQGAWQRAHAMRRRLDRVNRTASLVSYEERAETAVPRAKAQRVRRRMHYAMSLQCFQATVTANGRRSREGSSADEDASPDDGEGGGSGSYFMCTPQSFPPTPVSRAHVMARTSQFSDDILFLARDQLRLGENLKPGVDETTRATADFLRRQQRLAVLDGNNACEGIVLTCGHHRATKVGPSLYSSARAMVPVLRNRHVYFQVSCIRDGPLAPSIGVGLSTPEMPLSTLVGAFSNSVGLCSTGQVLMSSRWYGLPGDFAVRRTGMSTVGVLVYLDGTRPFRSWDGDMVRALVSFSIDGRLVRVATGPAAGPQPPTAAAAAISGGGIGGGAAFSPQLHQPTQSPVRVAGFPFQPVQQAGAAAPRDEAAVAAGVNEAVQQQQQQQGEGRLVLPSSWPSPVEEIAPWEAAAASGASAAAAAAGEARTAGGAVPGFGIRVVAPTAATAATATPTVVPETSAALGLALPKDRDLFPTVTIHSANTEVLCRFCAEDLVWITRENMGAPPGVPVYALDGSLIDLPQNS